MDKEQIIHYVVKYLYRVLPDKANDDDVLKAFSHIIEAKIGGEDEQFHKTANSKGKGRR